MPPVPQPLNLSRKERERIGFLLRDAAVAYDDCGVLLALAAKVDPWHDRSGNPIGGA